MVVAMVRRRLPPDRADAEARAAGLTVEVLAGGGLPLPRPAPGPTRRAPCPPGTGQPARGPAHGAEVFSLMRDSDQAPADYLSSFFDTGREHQGA